MARVSGRIQDILPQLAAGHELTGGSHNPS
jgi:hypothetical protein